MVYADYDYYLNEYKGNTIPEADFERLETRARSYLASITRVELIGDPVKMAVCAVAEAWQTNEQGGDIASQSVGPWSKSYNKISKSDDERLYEAARLYLGSLVSKVRWA